MADQDQIDDQIDGGPLREGENRALRLLLEKERARERLVQRMRFWVPMLSATTTGYVVVTQTGFVDWLAGILVRIAHK